MRQRLIALVALVAALALVMWGLLSERLSLGLLVVVAVGALLGRVVGLLLARSFHHRGQAVREQSPPRWRALGPGLGGLGMLLTLTGGAHGLARLVVVVLVVASLGFALIVLLWPRRQR